MASLGLAFLAGLLSIFSPCVLPLLPLVLGAAASEHKFGPVALAAGLALSFVTVGLFVATIGFSIGVNAGVFRTISAYIMIAIGAVLVLPNFQAKLALAGGPLPTGRKQNSAGFLPPGLRVNSSSACYSALSGALVSVRHLERHHCWPLREKT